jgi:methylenetetrahydrofolate dehydrogenase (NADP+) / methenyltetrahydrofolate cyclohydrolase
MNPSESVPRILRGAPIAADLRHKIAADVADFCANYDRVPALAVVIVGSDAPSSVYLHKILDGCRRVGIAERLVELGADSGPEHMRDMICALNDDPLVAGIIVQMPLPPTIPLRTVIDSLDPAKDIDGIHPLNAGLLALGYHGYLPATAHASVEILTRSGFDLCGKHAVVVGRSNIVGKPAALLLLAQDATVTICHSRTPDLADEIRRADVLVVAVGRAGLITGDMLKPGAVVVDVGINVVGDRLVGDVDESAYAVASAITPVPGGVGPLTNAILLSHLMDAARDQAEGRRALGARPLVMSAKEAAR